ncbi:hypothetical protein ADEAN_000935500 [Angomonas deanei]|uniref:Uncharacterized protein n=1 Tax=Angomonas deanei TaxID=59799 RepID=A0A7G2CPX2_9TRYP|nr:hypothetical protein ADEAN_000935500 [Angomonas deanei]
MSANAMTVSPYDCDSIFISKVLFSLHESEPAGGDGTERSLPLVKAIPIDGTHFLVSIENSSKLQKNLCEDYSNGKPGTSEMVLVSVSSEPSGGFKTIKLNGLPFTHISDYVRDCSVSYYSLLDTLRTTLENKSNTLEEDEPAEEDDTADNEKSNATVDQRSLDTIQLRKNSHFPHRFLVSSDHCVWCIECKLDSVKDTEHSVTVVSPSDFFPREEDTTTTTTTLCPLIGSKKGCCDGTFSEAMFNHPTSMCWQIEEPDTEGDNRLLAPHSCSRLFIADMNYSIRLADFQTKLVRSIVGLLPDDRVPRGVPSGASSPSCGSTFCGYRDGAHTEAQINCVTSMVCCKEGLLFADPYNRAVRIVTGVKSLSEVKEKAEASPARGDKCCVWTVAGEAMASGGDVFRYKDDSSLLRARFHFPSKLQLVPMNGTEEAAVWVLDNDPSSPTANHAVRVLSSRGVQTLIGPLDYSSVDGQQESEETRFIQHTGAVDTEGTPKALLYGTQVIPVSLITREEPRQTDEHSTTGDVYFSRSAFIIVDSLNSALTLFLSVSSDFMTVLMKETQEKCKAQKQAEEEDQNSGFEEFFEKQLEAEELKLLALGNTLHGVQMLSEPSATPCVRQLRAGGGVDEIDLSSSDSHTSFMRIHLPWILPPPLLTIHEAVKDTYYCHVSGAGTLGRKDEPTCSETLLFRPFSKPTEGRKEERDEETHSNTHSAENSEDREPKSATEEGEPSTSSSSKPRKKQTLPTPHPTGGKSQKLLIPPEPSPPPARDEKVKKPRPTSYSERLTEMTEEEKKSLFLAKNVIPKDAATAEENAENVSLIDEEERCELIHRYNESNGSLHSSVCDAASGADADGKGDTHPDKVGGKRRASSQKCGGRSGSAPLTPRSKASHLLVRQPHRGRNAKEETPSCTELKNGSVLTPRETKAKSPQTREEVDLSIGELLLKEQYDCAVEDLYVVFCFFADKTTKTSVSSSTDCDETSATVHEEVRYSLSLTSLWWILHNGNYLDLPSRFSKEVFGLFEDRGKGGVLGQFVEGKGMDGSRFSNFSVEDMRAVLLVLYEKIGIVEFGYHVVGEIDFQLFRRIMLFFSLWERHIGRFLSSLEKKSDGTNGDSSTRKHSDTSRPVYSSERIREIISGCDAERRRELRFALLDDMPSLDSLEEEEVIFYYSDAFSRCEKYNDGRNAFTSSKLYKWHHPLRTYSTARKGSTGKKDGPRSDEQSGELDEKVDNLSPIERDTDMGGSKWTESRVSGTNGLRPVVDQLFLLAGTKREHPTNAVRPVQGANHHTERSPLLHTAGRPVCVPQKWCVRRGKGRLDSPAERGRGEASPGEEEHQV